MQPISPRLSTAAARVSDQITSCRICGGQSGTGAGFMRLLRFPLPILIPPTAPQSSFAHMVYARNVCRGNFLKTV
jgi:hypothetical protein